MSNLEFEWPGWIEPVLYTLLFLGLIISAGMSLRDERIYGDAKCESVCGSQNYYFSAGGLFGSDSCTCSQNNLTEYQR
jgi:hypothetical protein